MSAPDGVLEVVERVPARAWRVMAVTAAGVFVVFLDATVVNIAFPALSADFSEATRADLSWVLNGYAVMFGALLVTAGRLADARGRRAVFLGGLVVFGLASALCGLAPSVGLLVAARVVQGVGAALLVPASLALLLPEFPASRRAGAVGLWGAAGGVAAATGPTLGALLVEGPGWRWVFLVNVPFCLAALVIGRRVLRESRGDVVPGPLDLLGIGLVTAVFGLLSLGLVQGESWGWSSWRVVGAFVLTALLVPVIVRRGLRHPNPVLPVRLFAVRTFSVATAALLLFSAAFFAVILCNVLFLTGVWGYSPLRTAVAVLPSPLLAATLSPVTGRLADRFGFRVLVVPGAAAMVAGVAWFVANTGTQPVVPDGLPARLGPHRAGHRVRVAGPRRGGCAVAAAGAVRCRQRRGGQRPPAGCGGRGGRPRRGPRRARAGRRARGLPPVVGGRGAGRAPVLRPQPRARRAPAAGRGPAGRAGRLRTAALHPRRSP